MDKVTIIILVLIAITLYSELCGTKEGYRDYLNDDKECDPDFAEYDGCSYNDMVKYCKDTLIPNKSADCCEKYGVCDDDNDDDDDDDNDNDDNDSDDDNDDDDDNNVRCKVLVSNEGCTADEIRDYCERKISPRESANCCTDYGICKDKKDTKVNVSSTTTTTVESSDGDNKTTMIIGIVVFVLIFLCVVGYFSYIYMQSQGQRNHEDMMNPGHVVTIPYEPTEYTNNNYQQPSHHELSQHYISQPSQPSQHYIPLPYNEPLNQYISPSHESS